MAVCPFAIQEAMRGQALIAIPQIHAGLPKAISL